MKQYFICKKEVAEKHKHCFCPRAGAHYLNLPNGEILICINFADEHSEDHWHGQDGIEALPHPMWDGNQSLHPDHHAKLKHLGIPDDATVHHVAHHAGKHQPLMRLKRFQKP